MTAGLTRRLMLCRGSVDATTFPIKLQNTSHVGITKISLKSCTQFRFNSAFTISLPSERASEAGKAKSSSTSFPVSPKEVQSCTPHDVTKTTGRIKKVGQEYLYLPSAWEEDRRPRP